MDGLVAKLASRALGGHAIARRRAARPKAGRQRGWPLPAALGMVVFLVGLLSPSVQVTDSRLTVVTATSLLTDHDLDLDEFDQVDRLGPAYDVVTVGGHRMWYFPWPIALWAVPAVAVARLFGVDTGRLRLGGTNQTWLLEIPVAAALVAATTIVIYLLALRLMPADRPRRQRLAVVVAAGFFLGSAAWSTATRALWGHTASMVFVALSVLLAVRGRGDPRFIPAIGATTALAYVMRPTNAISMVILSVWVLLRHRRALPAYLGCALLVAAPFVTANLLAYHALLPPYYSGGRLGGSGTFWAGLAGTLISPSRGLLWYLPLALLVPLGIVARIRRRDADLLDGALAAILVLHWLLIASWTDWLGGSAYGPRLFTEVLPVFAYFAVPGLLTVLDAAGQGRRRLRYGAVLLAVASVLVNAQGALLRSTFCWNATPVSIEHQPDRVWDWADPQALRAVRDLAHHHNLATVIAGDCVP